MVIVDGAMLISQLLVDEIPVLATIALPQSSGGNFWLEVGNISGQPRDGDIGPPVALGDLLAPTEVVTPTDGDGDSSTATVTFSIGDATPIAGANPVAQLDDDVLAGGDAGGIDDDIDAANLVGTLSGEGGDVPRTWAFLLTGAPAGFSYVSDGAGGVLVQQGGITVLTITLDSASGAYTVAQNAPIVHAAGGDENNQGFTLAYTVTDVDGDSATGTLAIDVDDDTPVASASTTQPVLTVDESDLATNASASFAGVFTTAFGADGAGSCRLYARHQCRFDRPHRHRHRQARWC